MNKFNNTPRHDHSMSLFHKVLCVLNAQSKYKNYVDLNPHSFKTQFVKVLIICYIADLNKYKCLKFKETWLKQEM